MMVYGDILLKVTMAMWLLIYLSQAIGVFSINTNLPKKRKLSIKKLILEQAKTKGYRNL
jgi:hypothetical protein